MDDYKGEKLVSSDSKVTCEDIQKMTCVAISPTVYSKAEIIEVIKLCRNRNEAMINRDVTPDCAVNQITLSQRRNKSVRAFYR